MAEEVLEIKLVDGGTSSGGGGGSAGAKKETADGGPGQGFWNSAFKVGAGGGVPGAALGGAAITAAASATPITAVLALVGAAVVAVVHKIHAEIDNAAKTAAKYNGSVATATGQAMAANFQGDVRRSAFLAPELTSYVQAQSAFDQAKKDVTAELLKPLIPVFTEFIQLATEAIKGGMDGVKKLGKMLDEFEAESPKIYKTFEIAGGPFLASLAKYLRQIAKNTEPAPPDKDFLDQLYNMNLPDIAGALKDAGRGNLDRNAPLGVPAFGGL